MWSHVKKRAFEIAKESKDFPKIGCVIYNQKTGEIISEGVAGVPYGIQHCDTKYENDTKHNHVIHAEMRAALALIKKKNVGHMGALVVGKSVCVDCAKALVEIGIREIYMPPVDEVGRWSDKTKAGLDLLIDGNVSVTMDKALIGYEERLNDGTKFPSLYNKTNSVNLAEPICITKITTLDGKVFDVYKIEKVNDSPSVSVLPGLTDINIIGSDKFPNKIPFRLLKLYYCKEGDVPLHRSITKNGKVRLPFLLGGFLQTLGEVTGKFINVLIYKLDGVMYVKPLSKNLVNNPHLIESYLMGEVYRVMPQEVKDETVVIVGHIHIGYTKFEPTDIADNIILTLHNVHRTTYDTPTEGNQQKVYLKEPDYHGEYNADPSTHKLTY